MTAHPDIKTVVRDKYGAIAEGRGGCCGGGCGCGAEQDPGIVGPSYGAVDGYVADADLGLGCGLPTQHAGIVAGETVLDLGSGAGIDAFIARRLVGEGGWVIGVDMTPGMIAKARANANRLGYANVEFRSGEIESLPVEDGTVDLVISNCVLNLVPDKRRAFGEIFRVLRPGGRFCISDIVASGPLPEAIRGAAELYVGCVAGAMQKDLYLETIARVGFEELHVAESRPVSLPDGMLEPHLPPDQIAAFRRTGAGLLSVTVVGVRPAC